MKKLKDTIKQYLRELNTLMNMVMSIRVQDNCKLL